MNNVVQVRNIRLGEGIPKVAVSIVGIDDDEIMQEISYLKTIKFDIAEWRVDYYEYAADIEKVKSILGKMRKSLGDIPLIFTFRTSKEGGKKKIDFKHYIKLNKTAASSGYIDIVDIELFICDDETIEKLVDYVHKFNVKVIMSNHDFNRTPSKDELVKRMCKMQGLGADIPKIAVMPKCSMDVLELLSATCEMKTYHSETPVITISMGPLGAISRLSGGTFGSVLTFGSAKAKSAPGQIDADELYRILRIIN